MIKDRQKDPYGNYLFFLEIEGHHTPSVVDYMREDLRNRLINADEIIIKDENITIRFTYLLSIEVLVECEKEGGFTRMDLFRLVYENYKRIYDEETAAVGDPGIYERLYNRKESDGPYGIWGHYLDDLYLEIIRYNPEKKVVYLSIGS